MTSFPWNAELGKAYSLLSNVGYLSALDLGAAVSSRGRSGGRSPRQQPQRGQGRAVPDRAAAARRAPGRRVRATAVTQWNTVERIVKNPLSTEGFQRNHAFKLSVFSKTLL